MMVHIDVELYTKFCLFGSYELPICLCYCPDIVTTEVSVVQM
jgi:hypothetical protein